MQVCVWVFMNVFLLHFAMVLLGCFVSYIFIAIYYCCYCYSNRWEDLLWFDAAGVYVLCALCLCLCIRMYRSSDSCSCFKAAQHSTQRTSIWYLYSKLNITFNIVHKIQNAASYSIYESCSKELSEHSLMATNIQSIHSFASIFFLCLCKFNNGCNKQIIIV